MLEQAVLLEELSTLPPQYFGEVLEFVNTLKQRRRGPDADEAAAYQAMAADTEREQEAREWCGASFGPT